MLMTIKPLTILFLFISTISFAQIKGTVTNKNNVPLPFVSVYLENTLTGTTTNDAGEYLLHIKKTGQHTLVFQFLGFQTLKKTINITSHHIALNVVLKEEHIHLNEVNVSSKENPAHRIIRNVITNKDKNTDKSGQYTADFYSRGLFRIKNAPKKILGQKIEGFDGLDSTRSGVIYLSETLSKITYQKKPKQFKEVIVASKVSGRDNGISFNQADEVNFNLYENHIDVGGTLLVSPIANSAFSNYRFKLEGTFYDKNNKLINKINLIPKRENDRVFSGTIYIVEDDWAIYGAELKTTGKQINNPIIDSLIIKQDYNYETTYGIWPLIQQTIDFKVGAFGFNFSGRYSASYSNYNFNPIYTTETFSKEVLSFEKEAIKRDSAYWNNRRAIPLTLEEKTDYKKKDRLKILKTSKTYLDSIDSKQNTFKILSPILGYRYKNSFKKWSFVYDSPLYNLRFNTIQGFHTSIGLGYSKTLNDTGKSWSTHANLNYGFSDKTFRPRVSFNKSWNSIDRPQLSISIGNSIVQFDDKNPINNLTNSSYSLLYKKNYAKYYEKSFAKIAFSKEVLVGVKLFSSLEYANRKPSFNTTDYSVFSNNLIYTTNNPLFPKSSNPIFDEHSIFKAQLSTQINFGSSYISYPNSRYTITNKKIPTLTLGYRKTFGSNDNTLHSDFVFSKISQSINCGTKGIMRYNLAGGVFINKKNTPFMDYYHPLSNKLYISLDNRLDRFRIMPYYKFSTNDAYFEAQIEHNFNGYILGKIPLVNKLNLHTVVGAKTYTSSSKQPYTEYSIGLGNIGWGKWRFLRVDYIRSTYNGTINNSVLFGLSLFFN